MKTVLAIFAAFNLVALPAVGGEKAVEETWFEIVDGTLAKGEYLDLNVKTNDRLFVRYGPISDSGVELERVLDGKVLWRKHVEPLGVEHSKYRHEVFVSIDGLSPDTIRVISIGEKAIYESRSLTDGRQLSRKIKELER